MKEIMIHAIIADDEINAMNEIKYIIDWEKNGIIIDSCALNGQEAIDLINEFSPDIVFCDICMPQKTGIDVLKYIKENQKNIIFIAISAYSDFNYVKQCLSLGAFNYLLKTIDKDELLQIIQQSKNIINQNSLNKHKLKTINILIDLMNNSNCTNRLKEINFDIRFNNFRVIITDKIIFDKNIVYEDAFSYIVIQNLKKNIVIVNYNNEQILKNFTLTLSPCAISSASHDLSKLYSEADIAYCSKKFFHNDISIYCKSNILEVEEIIKKININYDVNFLEAMLAEKLHSIKELAALYNFYTKQDLNDYLSYSDIYYNYNNLNDFLSDIIKYKDDDNNNLIDMDKTLEDIKNYINQNFDKDISITQLSNKFFISASYLNLIFKKRFNTTINKFIIDLRMEKALDLINNKKDFTLLQISQLVGYKDFYYFSRIFKKIYGKAPSFYRDNIENE